MPQLDKLTFVTQLSWVFLLFLMLYIHMLRFSLPALATVLKLRSRKVSESISLNQDEQAGSFNLPTSSSTIFNAQLIEDTKTAQMRSNDYINYFTTNAIVQSKIAQQSFNFLNLKTS